MRYEFLFHCRNNKEKNNDASYLLWGEGEGEGMINCKSIHRIVTENILEMF